MDWERLAHRAGATPFFVYDRAAVTARVAALRAALPAGIAVTYAVKANPMPALVQCLAGLVDGLDVASAGELRLALDTPVAPERVSFAGPGKSDAELAAAVAGGVTLELESAGELARLAHQARVVGVPARVAVRINPDFAVRGAGLRMGGGPAPFGVDAEAVPEVLAAMAALPELVRFEGFHVFPGSQNLDAGALARAQEQTLRLAARLAPHAPGPVRTLNLGGGFGIPYASRDRPLDLAAVGRSLHAVAAEAADLLPGTRLVLELGRYLVGEAGTYVTRVVDRKVSRGRTYLVVDGGMHHQLAASGHLGQVVRRNYPVSARPRVQGGATERVTVVGRLCTPLDLLADDVELPVTAVGDLVGIGQAGAYGRSASPTDFLGHPAPVELLV